MSATLGISTLGSTAIGAAYYYLAPKLSTLSTLSITEQTKAFGVSSIIQGLFLVRDEYNTEEKGVYEKVFRYSVPYILIGGGSIYADKSLLKVNLISSAILGTAQIAVSKVSSILIDNWVNSSKFGAASWENHFGNVGPEPDLPEDIEETLNSPCPFWPEKKIRDTHMLTLIPATVNGEPFTLNKFSELTRNPKRGYKAECVISDDVKESIKNKKIKKSYWILMTKEMVPKSCGPKKDYGFSVDQKALFNGLNHHYEAPKVIEAVTGILTYHVRRGHKLYKKTVKQEYDFSGRETHIYYTQTNIDNNLHSVHVGNFEKNHLRVSLVEKTEIVSDNEDGIYSHLDNDGTFNPSSTYFQVGIAAVHRL